MRGIIANYIQHRAEGYSKESFPDCDYRTIASHLSKHEFELQPEKAGIEKAERLGQLEWERIGKQLANGQIEGNATSYIFNMKNRYGWSDKRELDQNLTLTMPDIEIVPYGSEDEETDQGD